MIHDRTFATMRLWSLWELIQFIAPDWLRVYTYFSSLRILLPPAPDKQVEKIEELLGNVRFLGQHCDELGLPMTEMLSREIVETVVSPADTDWHHFCALLDRSPTGFMVIPPHDRGASYRVRFVLQKRCDLR